MKENVKMHILDCTLRDGGYVNNWEFDTDTAKAIMDGLYDSGVRYIEIGILGKNAQAGKQTKFNDFSAMEPLLENRKADCHYAVMFTQENAGNFEFPVRSDKTPDCIRLAYFKKTWREALEKADELKRKGYEVFLQAMATFMYSTQEMQEMIEAINRFEPAAFYMVDSFSTMYPADVAKMRDEVLALLSDKIAFGFHAHNNIQMAYANVQEFLRCDTQRTLFVDSSVFGMGRGAGNVPTELLMEYLNKTQQAGYKIGTVLKLYQQYLEKVYHQYGWGYTLPYYLTAAKSVNSAYGWYFTSHGVQDVEQLEWALEQVPDEISYALKPAVADDIMSRLKNK